MREQKIILFGHSRCGSTSLFRAINTHPLTQLILEPFHEKRQTWGYGGKNYRVLIYSKDDLERELSEIYLSYSGFKTLSYQLPQEYNEHILGNLKKTDKIILLHRKNVLQSAVSEHVGIETELWNVIETIEGMKDSETIRQRTMQHRLKPINIEWLKVKINLYKKIGTHYKDFLLRIQQPFLELTYDELFPPSKKAIHNNITKIYNYLDLFLPDKETINSIEKLFAPHRKVSNTAIYRLIPNIDEIEKEFGGGENGYLFKE